VGKEERRRESSGGKVKVVGGASYEGASFLSFFLQDFDFRSTIYWPSLYMQNFAKVKGI
jgi:hypothetical protein